MLRLSPILWAALLVVLLAACAKHTRRAPEAAPPPAAAKPAEKNFLEQAGDATWNTTKAVVEAPVKAFAPKLTPRSKPATRPTYEPPDTIIMSRDADTPVVMPMVPEPTGPTTRPRP